jgi:hypothetical protein
LLPLALQIRKINMVAQAADIAVEPWTRPPKTTLIPEEDYADLTTLDLSTFDEPGGKEA